MPRHWGNRCRANEGEGVFEGCCAFVAARLFVHPSRSSDATATNLIHPRDTSRTQNSETTKQQTSERSAPPPNNWTAARTATCRNTMPPPPFPKPLWSKQQTTHGEASPHWLHDKGTPERGIETNDHVMPMILTTQNRTRWWDHPCPPDKPPQEQYQLEQQDLAAYETKVPHANPLDGNHPNQPPPYHAYAQTNAYAPLANGPLTLDKPPHRSNRTKNKPRPTNDHHRGPTREVEQRCRTPTPLRKTTQTTYPPNKACAPTKAHAITTNGTMTQDKPPHYSDRSKSFRPTNDYQREPLHDLKQRCGTPPPLRKTI